MASSRGSIVRKPGGNYAIRYYGPDKKRHFETIGPSKRKAEQELARIVSGLYEGTWRPPSTETFELYARRWLEQRDPAHVAEGSRGRLRASTFVEYRRAVDRAIAVFGQMPLAAINPETIDAFVLKLEKGTYAEDGQPLAAGTVRNTITPLRKLLGDAHRQGKIAANPAVNADLPPAQDFRGQEIPVEHTAAIKAALAALAPRQVLRDEPDPFFVHLFDVALGTGMRLGELRALRWGDVDRKRKRISVERAYSRRELQTPKTEAGTRRVPLFASVAAALDALAGRALELGRYAPGELVFGTALGKPLHESNVNRRVWQPALRKAERMLVNEALERGELVDVKLTYRFHDLRHTCVSRLVAAGADVKLVQSVAGHSNPMITLKRYSHLLDGRVTEAADLFDPAGGHQPGTNSARAPIGVELETKESPT